MIAASESATDETDQADRLRRTETATQALSLTQLNGMPGDCINADRYGLVGRAAYSGVSNEYNAE
ncbi:MAG: hypothetical protein NVS2B12_02740 [Ktedonobacteraceae bacterium]